MPTIGVTLAQLTAVNNTLGIAAVLYTKLLTAVLSIIVVTNAGAVLNFAPTSISESDLNSLFPAKTVNVNTITL